MNVHHIRETKEQMKTAGALGTHEEEDKQKREDWVGREPAQGRSKRLWSVLFVVIKLNECSNIDKLLC